MRGQTIVTALALTVSVVALAITLRGVPLDERDADRGIRQPLQALENRLGKVEEELDQLAQTAHGLETLVARRPLDSGKAPAQESDSRDTTVALEEKLNDVLARLDDVTQRLESVEVPPVPVPAALASREGSAL